MSIKLTPDVYTKGLKWNLKRENQIDTFTFSLYYFNSVAVNLDSRIVQQVKVSGSNVMLPATGNSFIAKGSDSHLMRGRSYTSKYNNGPYDYSHGFVATIWGEFTFDLLLNEPINSLNIDIVLRGKTRKANNPGWGGCFNFYDDHKTSRDVVTYVDNHLQEESSEWAYQSSYVDYSTDYINLNPYVKHVIDCNNDPDNPNLTPASDILTKWCDHPSPVPDDGAYEWYGYWMSSLADLWVHYSVSDDDGQHSYRSSAKGTKTAWPAVIRIPWGPYHNSEGWHSNGNKMDCRIKRLHRLRGHITKEIIKVNDYNYTLKVNVPIKYIYMAATRCNVTYETTVLEIQYEKDLNTDSLAFYDMITAIQCDTSGYKYADSYNEYSYSLSDNGLTVTDDVKNTSAFKIKQNNFIKSDTTVDGVLWANYWPIRILRLYKRGRYVVEATVLAEWAIENNIQINSQITVKLPNNTNISQVVNRSSGYAIVSDGKSIYAKRLGREYIFNDSSKMRTQTWIIEGQHISARFWIYDASTQRLYRDSTGITATNYSALTKIVCIGENDTATATALGLTAGYLYLISQDGYGEDVITYSVETRILDTTTLYGPNSKVLLAMDMNPEVNLDNQYRSAIERCCKSGAYVDHYYWNVEKTTSVFAVKNITKIFNDDEFVYNLRMVEEAEEAEQRGLVYFTTPPTSISLNVEYFFKNVMSINTNIARIDMRSNNIHFRLRANNSLDVIRDYYIGRIVINRSENWIRTYKWITGTTYQGYETFDLASLATQDYILTMEIDRSLNSQYNATELYKNLAGYVET